MAGLVVFIICVILAVLTFRRVSNRSKNKGRGKYRTLIASVAMGFIVFVISICIGAGVVSKDKNADIKAPAVGSAQKTKTNLYTCDKFDAVTQTRQGTKYNSGYYSDGEFKTIITYFLTDDELTTKMVTPGFDDNIDTAKFNKVADDGSRKYGNSSTNYFISVLNDNTIKVISVNFNVNMTLTQICSK